MPNTAEQLAKLEPWPKSTDGSYDPPDGSADTCWRELLTMEAVLKDAMDSGQMPEGNLALSRLIIEDLAQARRAIEMFYCWMEGTSPSSSQPGTIEKIAKSPKARLTEIKQAAETQWVINQTKLDDALNGRSPKLDKATFKGGFMQGAGWAHKNLADAVQRVDAERKAKRVSPKAFAVR